jgi:hypothetical protein
MLIRKYRQGKYNLNLSREALGSDFGFRYAPLIGEGPAIKESRDE